MARRLSPSQIAARYARGYAASTEAYREGVQRVSENPAAKAAMAKDRWFRSLQEAYQSGRFEAGLQRVTLQSWQQAAIEKGAPAMAAAARLAQANYEAAEREIGPQRDAIVASLPQRGTLEDNIARATEFIRRMASVRRGVRA